MMSTSQQAIYGSRPKVKNDKLLHELTLVGYMKSAGRETIFLLLVATACARKGMICGS
jgi:hypothetical protein